MAGIIRIATLVGVGVLVAMNTKMLTDTGSFKESVSQLNERIDGVNNRIVALANDVKNSRAAAPQRGPDPNKVYPIRVEGAPAEGPANAPIVIAEFSDFQ
jgi:protein-disulfide isomerase